MSHAPSKWLSKRIEMLWILAEGEEKAFNNYFSIDWDIESTYMKYYNEANDDVPEASVRPFTWLNDRMKGRWIITTDDQMAFNNVFGFDNTIEEINAMWHCEANEGGPAHFDWTYIFSKPLEDDKLKAPRIMPLA